MSQSEEISAGLLDSPPPELESRETIYILKDEPFMTALIETLEHSNSGEFLGKVKDILKFLHGRFSQKSVDDADKLSGMVREVWQDPCFVSCVRSTIEKDYSTVLYALFCSNNNSPTVRMNHMEADWCFEPSLLSTISDTTDTTTMRVFLSILIGHWNGETELRELDVRMGENHFGKRMDLVVATKPQIMALVAQKIEMDEVSYIMKSAGDVGDMEPLRKELVSKYGEEGLNIKAILEKVRNDLKKFVDINRKYIGYDGGEARILISISDGRCCGISMSCNRNPY